jgi:hypothetical protein
MADRPKAKSGPGGASRKGRATGRATAKGTARPATGRYTPPIPRSVRVSPRWMGPLILFFLIAGAITIVLNYFNVLPGGPSNWYLLVGIGVIAAGFITATQYH